LVAHGIGQQHPFQTLDNMSQGLRRAMQDRGEPTVSMTHIKRGADCPFGHYIRLQSRSMTLDIYEYFWASKTQGKATFLDAVRWVLVTAVTPLQRLAYNVPLIIERAAGAGSRMGFWRSLTSEMLHEVLRLVYIPFTFALIAIGAAVLAVHAEQLARQLLSMFEGLSIFPLTADKLLDMGILLWFVTAGGAFLAILWSLPWQIRDLNRTWQRLSSRRVSMVGQFRRRFGLTREPVEPVPGLDWSVEIPSRQILLVLSGAALIVLGASLWLLWSTRVVTYLRHAIGPEVLTVIGLVALSFLIKRVFLDYVADIALYTTADENSAFYKTRLEILTESTDKLRWLLQQNDYDEVALAGHSLGSVITYDTMGWLRMESQVDVGAAAAGRPPSITEAQLSKLTAYMTFGSPLNKVAYFFRTTLGPHETVRAHILNELHGFRRLSSSHDDPDVKDARLFKPPDAVRWLNISAALDPVSARLVLFRGVSEVRRPYWLPGFCHTSYWHDEEVYRHLLNTIAP
jgi:hypothetical protein